MTSEQDALADISAAKVGALIRARRHKLRMTLQTLGRQAGVSVEYLSQVERNQVRSPCFAPMPTNGAADGEAGGSAKRAIRRSATGHPSRHNRRRSACFALHR